MVIKGWQPYPSTPITVGQPVCDPLQKIVIGLDQEKVLENGAGF